RAWFNSAIVWFLYSGWARTMLRMAHGKAMTWTGPVSRVSTICVAIVRATVTLGTSRALKMSMLVARPADMGMSWLPATITVWMPCAARRVMRRANSRWWVGVGSRVL